MATETLTGSGSWVAPYWVTVLTKMAPVAAGGGGGADGGGGGAGGAGTLYSNYSVTPGGSYSYGCGGGGAGGVSSGADGGGGGSSNFDGQTSGDGGPGGINSGAPGDASGEAGERQGGSGVGLSGGSAASPQSSSPGGDGAASGNPGDGGAGGGLSSDGSAGGGGYIYLEYDDEPAPASAPSGLAATTLQSGHIPVSWGSVAHATGYRLYSADDAYTTPIYDGAGLSFDDTGLGFNVTKSYKVTAYNGSGETAKSSSVTATTASAATTGAMFIF